MPYIADRLSPTARAESREPFNLAEPAEVTVGRGAVAVRAVIVAAVLLLALGSQLSTREFDAGWMLALVATLAIAAALAVLVLRHLGATGGLAARWSAMMERRALARADARFLARAAHDPRLMAELQAAMSRQPAVDAAGAQMRARVDIAAGRLARERAF